ncbi:MAG: transcriptional repressor [Bacteroidales bacterium]|nr:transcriptional repressor [Bacteroidales bacterium]
MNTENKNANIVLKKFENFIRKKKLRNTNERNIILKEIYKNEGHFNPDDLYIRLKLAGYNISRATVYNTLQLLEEANLIIKHYFKENSAIYEKVNFSSPHYHLICIKCGKVTEFEEKEIKQLVKRIVGKYGHKHLNHSMYIYGLCKLCNSF